MKLKALFKHVTLMSLKKGLVTKMYVYLVLVLIA